MTQLFYTTPIPVGGSIEQEAQQALRVTNQNFRSLTEYLNRAVAAGSLVADGSVTLAMLATAAKTLVGDVTGLISATTVEKIRGKSVATPAAGDDGKSLTYNHGGSSFVYTDKLNDVLTTRGDLVYRGATAEARLAVGSVNQVLKSDGTDPGWSSISALIDAAFGNAQGDILVRGAAAWQALAPGTSGWFLKSQGAGADLVWAAGAAGSISPLTTKGDIWAYSTVDARLGVGSDTQVLSADSSTATGLKWVAAGGYTPPVTTKGDLFGFSTVSARIPIGTDGYILTADSAQALGLKWAAPASSASHNLLDGSLHPDTVAGTVVRGDLIYGNSTPKWARMAVGTLRGQRLSTKDDASGDIEWKREIGFPMTRSYLTQATGNNGAVVNNGAGCNAFQVGTLAASGDASRLCNKFTSTTTTGTRAGLVASGASVLTPAMNVLFACDFRLVTMTGAAGVCFQAGLAVTVPASGVSTKLAAANHHVALSFLAGTDTNFMFRTGDGATASESDTGIAKDTAWHDLVFYTLDAGVTWVCELDGVVVVTGKTTNVPGTTQVLSPFCEMGVAASNPTSLDIRNGYLNVLGGKGF